MPVTIIEKIKETNMVVDEKTVELLLNSKLDVKARIGNGDAEVTGGGNPAGMLLLAAMLIRAAAEKDRQIEVMQIVSDMLQILNAKGGRS